MGRKIHAYTLYDSHDVYDSYARMNSSKQHLGVVIGFPRRNRIFLVQLTTVVFSTIPITSQCMICMNEARYQHHEHEQPVPRR